MSDGEFDNIQFEKTSRRLIDIQSDDENENDMENIDNKIFGSAMTQNLFGNKRICIDEYKDNMKSIKPRNKFEKILEEQNAIIKFDDSENRYLIIFKDRQNHDDFTRNIDRRISNECGTESVFEELSAACNNKEYFKLYLSPTNSKYGQQDTILRAFLLSKHTQTQSFELIIDNLVQLVRSEEESDLKLAVMCIAHMRYLERLFEPDKIFGMIFETSFQRWPRTVRDGLISAIPDIFNEYVHHQKAAVHLCEIIESNENINDVQHLQFTIVESFKYLRMDSTTARQIRKTLCSILMKIDSSCLSNIVAFSLDSLFEINSKDDDNEELMHELIEDFSKNFDVSNIRESLISYRSNSIDNIVTEIFAQFLNYIQFERKEWKYISSYFNRKYSFEENAAEMETLNYFEVMLIISLISSDCCSQAFTNILNTKILQTSMTTRLQMKQFVHIIKTIISFKKFSVNNLKSLLYIARQCIWSENQNVESMGVDIYVQLFIGFDKKERKVIFKDVMKYYGQSDKECESALAVITKVIKTEPNAILEFVKDIQDCLISIPNLSIENVKRLFGVFIMLSTKKLDDSIAKFDIEETINRFLLSLNEKEKLYGILGVITKIEYDIQKRYSEERDSSIKRSIERITESINGSSRLNVEFYENMTITLKQINLKEESSVLNEWFENLLIYFKRYFFLKTSERYTVNLTSEKFSEASPLFLLLKELSILKRNGSISDSVWTGNHVQLLDPLLFAFEANIEIDQLNSVKGKDKYFEKLFLLIQWCRNIINCFVSSYVELQNEADKDKSKEYLINLFVIMRNCEEKLITELRKVPSWKVPLFNCSNENIVIINSQKNPSNGRKRKIDEPNVSPTSDDSKERLNMDDDGDIDSKDKQNIGTQLKSNFVPLEICAIAYLLTMTNNKRNSVKYLCESLIITLKEFNKYQKANRSNRFGRVSKNINYKSNYGDVTTIGDYLKLASGEIWKTLKKTFAYFSSQIQVNTENEFQMLFDMEDLTEKCLILLDLLVKGDFYHNDENLSKADKNEKQSLLLLTMVKHISDNEGQGIEVKIENDLEICRLEIGKYLLQNAEIVPTPSIAVALLNVFASLKIDNKDSRKTMAKYALAYIKKDWSKSDRIQMKGTMFNTFVRDILKHYIALRPECEQLGAINWILTNKVVQLVPDEDRRISNAFSRKSSDDTLDDDDDSSFKCINKNTFGIVYKTLFSLLNNIICRKEFSMNGIKKNLISEELTMTYWETASSCFMILCLLLRVSKIRTVPVLYTALKEGKQFLICVSKKSSFFYIIDNIKKGKNFDVTCQMIDRILYAVQQGNRVLQSIGNYAKANKCVNLLKKFPELRAESENCLRIIRSAMVKNQCLDAFTVGILKSRSIDGEIITDIQDELSDSD